MPTRRRGLHRGVSARSRQAGPVPGGRRAIEANLEKDPTVTGSIRSTLRAPLGRAYNRLTEGGIRHGTGNECEDRFLRFYQKGGDGEVDTNPLAMLSKTEVYQLAMALAERLDAFSAYRSTMSARPSPDLWAEGDAHNDEDELLEMTGAPFTYGRLDPDTGRILAFGTIEMVSRFVDARGNVGDLFADSLPDETLALLIEAAGDGRDRHFPGIDGDTVELLLRTARRVERITRHKWNPNIPSLGVRSELVEQGLLSDDLVTG